MLLALEPLRKEKEVAAMLKRGRAYLLAVQEEDGSWPETTRPAGSVSYAQRISTSGWATLALLATRQSSRSHAPRGNAESPLRGARRRAVKARP